MIEIINLSKEYVDKYGYKKILFQNLSFSLKENEISSIIAPIGAGKSSLLKIIAGLEKPTSGEVKCKNTNPLIFIPTEPSSFTWLNVKENISFELSDFDDSKIEQLIALVGLEGYENHIPHNKSLGFRFRISLARALARNPLAVLLDEPFTRTDPQTRSELYLLIKDVNKKLGTAFLLATTNITEAIFLSNRIYLMKKNPGEIFKAIDVDFKQYNDLSTITLPKFEQTREMIINAFKTTDFQNLLSDIII